MRNSPWILDIGVALAVADASQANFGEGEAYDWGTGREPGTERVALQANVIDCTRNARVGRRVCTLRLHGRCVWRWCARRAESATMTRFFFSALGALFLRSHRSRADWPESRCSMGSCAVRLMRAVDVTV